MIKVVILACTDTNLLEMKNLLVVPGINKISRVPIILMIFHESISFLLVQY